MELGKLIKEIVLDGYRDQYNYIRLYEHGVRLENTHEDESVDFKWSEAFDLLWWFPEEVKK